MQLKASPNCHLINAPTLSFCLKCGYPVTEDAKLDTESIGDTIRQLLCENSTEQNAIIYVLKELKNKYLM